MPGLLFEPFLLHLITALFSFIQLLTKNIYDEKINRIGYYRFISCM